MRRRNNVGVLIVGLIIAVNIFSVIGGLVSALIGFAFVGGIAALLISAIKGVVGSKQDVVRPMKRNTQTTGYTAKRSTASTVSSDNRKLIDNKLRAYFDEHVYLPIVNDICFTTKGGPYESLDELYISYKQEKAIRFGDFKGRYRDIYNKLVGLLVTFAKQDSVINKTKVQEKPVKSQLSRTQTYINKIDALNDAIPHEEISNGLYQTCDLLKKIEKGAKETDAKDDKLYDYYLPILVNILEKYKTLQDGDRESADFKKSESQLIKTIILINEALKTIYASQHENDYMDLNADMSTLQSLLQKDGYGDDPFGGQRR